MAYGRDYIHRFTEVASAPTPDLAPAALLIARLEYPRLDSSAYLAKLDRLGEAATQRVAGLTTAAPIARIAEISRFLFEEQGFSGNKQHYDDPRNSFLNQVIDRRTGIPITLALVYMEVARRADVAIDGINFPGHFLLKIPPRPDTIAPGHQHVIVDPFHGGAVLSESDCRNLLREHAGEEAAFDQRLLARATKQEILVRMLVNLKRIYVRMRSFPQARMMTELLLALDPSAMTELRDRGLLAYHLNDYAAALRDLEAYLHFTARGGDPAAAEPAPDDDDDDGDGDDDDSEASEQAEIWEHVKTLRRRVASLN